MFPKQNLRRLSHLLLAAGLSAASAAPSVYVAYPFDNYRVAADHVILEGSVPAGAALTISGQAVAVAPDGLYMLWYPLNVGVNNLNMVASLGGETGSTSLRITRTVHTVLPSKPTAIARATLTPRENTEFWDAPGDSAAERTVQVSFEGSPGGKATWQLALSPAQSMREGPAGTYSASFVLPEQASVRNAALSVHLSGEDGRTVSATAPGRLSSTPGAIRIGVQKPGTVVGLGLNDAQNVTTDLQGQAALYPRVGMTFTLVGRLGSDVRARLAPGTSVLISAEQLLVSAGRPAPASSGQLSIVGAQGSPPLAAQQPASSALASAAMPASAAANPAPVVNPAQIPSTPVSSVAPQPQPQPSQPRTPQDTRLPTTTAPTVPVGLSAGAPSPLSPATYPATSDLQIRVPLGGSKVPFTFEQSGPGQLTLNLYGLSTGPTAPATTDPLLGKVSVAARPGASTVVFELNTAQLWGFSANYEGDDLLLSVRRPPVLDAARPLAGRTITLDPGHGGTQKGGAGSFGIPEKDIVLPIGLRVAELLRAQGATINMTRSGDSTLGLYERDLSAETTHSDLLVSIHANALPDGRDPRGVRGPEVHFSRPQASAVAQSILNQLRAKLPEISAGKGLIPDANLALTRPTTQISLLVETAYLTDADNLRVLSSADGKERFAQAIAGGIIDFYAAQPKN